MCAPKIHRQRNIGQTHRSAPTAMAIRQKNRKTNNVGAHRCVRPTHTSKQPGRHTGLPLREKNNKTQEHKDKQCRGAPMCAPKHTQAKNSRADTPVCPYGKTIRQKNTRTNNVGAHRCVRPTHTKNSRADTPVCPYGKRL